MENCNSFWKKSPIFSQQPPSRSYQAPILENLVGGSILQQKRGANYVKSHSLLWNHPTEPWYNMLETLEIQRENRWYEIVSKTHSTCPTWRLSGASQWGSQISSCPSPSVGFELRIFQIFVLPVIPLGQPPRMKKKDNKKNNTWKIRTLLWFTWLEPISA